MESPRLMLRTLIAIAATLATMAFVFSFFPSVEVYRNEELLGTRAVVEHANWLLGLLVIYLAPAALIWKRPQLPYALLWSIWTVIVTAVAYMATFDLGNWSVHTVQLWPAAVFGYLMSALLVLLIIVVPVACGVFWWIKRARPPRPTLPTARLVKTRA
jgi:cellulose synthase/poly-beta-1,6-N-acetylglucosamine synthase-like glycosyltransferase